MHHRLSSFLYLATSAILAGHAVAKDSAVVAQSLAKSDPDGSTFWYDVSHFDLEGKGWADTKAPYDRLPAKAEGVVREAVWSLSRHSAGMCVRFATDAQSLRARWTLTSKNLAMPHMPATGVSGLDLYVRSKPTDRWHWLGVGVPASAPTNTALLAGGWPAGKREYLLYLPLYNGVTAVEIGVPKASTMQKMPPRSAEQSKPIVFYGTSITQGGCASRPGMVHTAILGRRLDRPVINLGFSGNGRMEAEVARFLAELDAAVYVIDCLPNMSGPGVEERTGALVGIIRKARPQAPILLVEDRTYANAFLVEGLQKHNTNSRAALRKAFDRLTASGVKHLHYLTGEDLLGRDGEDTVDGSHPTDLGFMRQADAFLKGLEPILAGQKPAP